MISDKTRELILECADNMDVIDSFLSGTNAKHVGGVVVVSVSDLAERIRNATR